MIDIFEEVKNADCVAISGHEKPDGDCIGASLGLYLYLKKRLPEKKIALYLQKPSDAFRNIPGIDEIISEYEPQNEPAYDVFIALDTVPQRMGAAYPIFERARKTINIDHHISNREGSGMVNYIVPEASATSELIARVIDRQYLDADIAALLYMGIAHDTGVFRFSNTSPETIRIVAELLEYGFDFPKLLDETFFEKTFRQNQIQSHIVLGSKLYFGGRLNIGIMDGKTMEQFGAARSDFEGVVNQLLDVRGVECAVLLYEKEPGLFKASLRSSSDLVDVARVSMVFGGGGHIRAAGCDIAGSGEEIAARLMAEIGKQMV